MILSSGIAMGLRFSTARRRLGNDCESDIMYVCIPWSLDNFSYFLNSPDT